MAPVGDQAVLAGCRASPFRQPEKVAVNGGRGPWCRINRLLSRVGIPSGRGQASVLEHLRSGDARLPFPPGSI